MEKKRVSKRLYVGGLGHTVSKAELQERFGKFGHVLDVEIITRKDDQGNPMKTFAYITVSISETDLRKCISILNKAKWKGGTLQIELAKESFLHRLAVEREEAKLQKEKPQRNDETLLLESLKRAGVVNFHMKAVPGTEVPDHKGLFAVLRYIQNQGLRMLTKNWVVGKFGRVLPILRLRSQQKNKIVKYDPSKYCHNLRKLEQDLMHVVPVSKLTWHLEGKDDSISKKRQGEFPVTKKQPKKLRQLGSEDLNGSAVLPSGCWSHLKHISSSQLDQRSKNKSNEKSKLLPPSSLCRKISGQGLLSEKNSISRVMSQNSIMRVSDGDSDLEEEIGVMIKKEMERQQVEDVETESDHLEIVGDNFELKYNTHWSLANLDTMKKVVEGNNKEKGTMEYDNSYDSADTDEIIAESKAPDLSSVKTAVLEDSKLVKVEKKEILTNKKCDLVNDSSLKTHKIVREGKMREPKISALPSKAVNSTAKTSDSESSYSESEEGESEISSDYASMMQNCYRLDLTLDDLEALATGNSGTSVEELDSTQSSSQCSVKENAKGNVVCKTKLSETPPAVKKKCICPEDIVAAILEGEEKADEESSKGQNNSCLKYQPFRGMGSLCEKELSKDSTGLQKKSVESLSFEASIPYCGEESSEGQSKNHPLYSLEVGAEKKQNVCCEQYKELSYAAYLADENDRPLCRPRLQGKSKEANSLQEDQNLECGGAVPNTDQSEGESSDMDSNAAVSQKHLKRQLKSPKLLSKKMKKDVSNTSSECEFKKRENRKTSLLENKELHGAASKESNTEKKQLQDNQRRLAALEERQKERELQKKLIQGALSNPDSQPANKHKHIIFNSDMESEAEVDEMLEKDESLGNTREKESLPKTSGRLFESSEDEQDDTDDERFKIKPQFEGKAGEKLLNLQSRFGTDERFRMDARFLESDSEEEAETNTSKADEEEELAAEKKKNLQILGSLLNIDLEHPKPTKMATNAKKFKDINTLRYDPTRQDHAVFERKPNATEKESKAKRKKKREESEKLPEVSKEIYYDIAVDLKELFGSSKSKPEKREEIPWDKDDAEESTPHDSLGPGVGSNTAQDSNGFTFSFFGDMDQSDIKEEPYVLETIKPVKVSWQEDPRFQDSSSEDDDEPEATEGERDKEIFSSLPQTGRARFFFFSKDDERLREGPKLFCRSVNLSEEKDSWEDRRRLLLEECRKKHKDARRKVKIKQ